MTGRFTGPFDPGRIPGEEALENPRPRSRTAATWVRLRRLVLIWGLILQAAAASTAAWAAARALFPSRAAVFAPVIAVITIAASFTERTRRAVEILVGVSLGLLVAGVLVRLFGTGYWQLGVVVAVTMAVAVVLGGGAALIIQAGVTSVLVATVGPSPGGLYYVRPADAFIGGVIGLVFAHLFSPFSPLRIVRRTGTAVTIELAAALRVCAEAARTGNTSLVRAARDRGVRAEERLDTFREALDVAHETVRAAPVRWRERGRIDRYLQAAAHVAYAVANTQVLLRRAVAVVERGEPAPSPVSASLDALAHAIDVLRHAVERHSLAGQPPDYTLTRKELVRAAGASAQGLGEAENLPIQVIIGQVRSVVVDLLVVTGLGYAAADRVVREEISKWGVDGSDVGDTSEQRAGPDEQAGGDQAQDA